MAAGPADFKTALFYAGPPLHTLRLCKVLWHEAKAPVTPGGARYRGLGVPLVARLRYYLAFGRVTCNGVTLTLENIAPRGIK